MKKKLNLSILGAGVLLLLSACGRSDVTSHSTGLWERLILMFGKAIQGLSFGGSIGLGIIIFTILIRAVMIPLYNRQIKSSRELQELQPELRRLQSEYPGRENREALVMNIMLPIFIFWFGTQISSGVALYWAVSNAFQVIQILVFNNPFKIIEERNRLEAEEKERKAKIRRAKKKAHKRK